MGNCLVTTLKGVVDNPNLPKYDYMRIHVHNPNGANNLKLLVDLSNVGDSDWYVVGADPSVIQHEAGAWDWTLGQGIYDLYIAGKYNWYRSIEGPGFSKPNDSYIWVEPEDIKYSDRLQKVSGCLIDGEIYNLGSAINEIGASWNINGHRPTGNIGEIFRTNPNLVSLYLQDTGDGITGALNSIALTDMARITGLELSIINPATYQDALTGNLQDLAPAIHLGVFGAIRRQHIGGSLEAFVEGQAAAGRCALPTPGTCIIDVRGLPYTLNGQTYVDGSEKNTLITYTATGATITKRNTSDLVATYTIGSGWTYA